MLAAVACAPTQTMALQIYTFGLLPPANLAITPARSGGVSLAWNAPYDDRVTGYGIIVFDKATREIRIECWPRGTDPAADPYGQYEGWPITIRHGKLLGAAEALVSTRRGSRT